jgi:hypothetical protein
VRNGCGRSCNGSRCGSTAHKLISCQIQEEGVSRTGGDCWRKEFLELVEIAEPKIIYQTGRMHFFAHDGFVMYTFECKESDFKQKVLHAIEFSNQAWSE